jgi:hypothetical protein
MSATTNDREIWPADTAKIHSKPKVPSDEGEASIRAQWLKLRVRRQGAIVAQLRFPVEAVERLDAFVDQKLCAKLLARGVAISNIIASAQNSGFAPGTLFEMQEPSQDVAIWLE